MVRIVQIAPVGFEYDRIIEGVNCHPCNIIYLLRSYKPAIKGADPDKLMIEIAENFVDKLEKHFQSTKICQPIVKNALIIDLEEIIKELCEIIQEEINKNHVDEIWINISTSTKLFVSAAMYVGSFKPEIVKLFYLDASHYTDNDLFKPNLKKEDIKKKFEEKGITYRLDSTSYKSVEVPSYPFEEIENTKKNILKSLKAMCDKRQIKEVRFMELLKDLNKDPYDKTVKMRFGHHIKKLKARNLIIEKTQGRQKKYSLTNQGRLLGLILSYF